MSIIKNTPDILKHNGLSFTTLINDTLELIENPATLGIYVYLASKPSDWVINETNLQNRFRKGRDFIKERIDELKSLRLLKKYSIRDDKGQIVRWETVLFSQPAIEEPHITENPDSGKGESTLLKNQVPGKTRCLEKPTHTNKGYIQIKEENKDLVCSDEQTSLRSFPKSPKTVTIKNYLSHPKYPSYARLYELYPKHKAGFDGFKAFLALDPHEELYEILLNDIKQRRHRDAQWQDDRFIPYIATYLRNSRWLDAITTAVPKKTFPTPQERAENERLTKEREAVAQKRKNAEMTQLREFKQLVENRMTDEQRKMGLKSIQTLKDKLKTG